MASVACLGLRRMADGFGGHRRRGLRAVRAALAACLPCGDGRGGSVIFSLISSAHPIGYGPPGSSNRFGSRVIPSTGRGFFSFSPDPLPPTLLCLLAVACSPVPGRGMCGLRPWLAVAGGGADCLRSSSPVPLSRCRSFARCYMPCVASCRCSYPGSCVAFYGLFRPLICRRWRF